MHSSLASVFAFLSLFIHQASTSALANTGRFHRDTSHHGPNDVSHHGWGYDAYNGPETWCKETPACCGLLQSPIDIIGDNSTHVNYDRFTLQHYSIPHILSLTNNGHTVVLTCKGKTPVPTISGGGLIGTYVLDSLHFHWGDNDYSGSEHTKDGLAYPLEAHFVHRNIKYLTMAEAQRHSDGLAVLAVFYNISQYNNNDIAPVVGELCHVGHADEASDVPRPVILRNLLPHSLRHFYRYKGSLTTPPCWEVVTWTIFDEPGRISAGQLVEFRSDVHYDKANLASQIEGGLPDTRLRNNHRNVQQGHQRIVQHNIPRLRFLQRIVNGILKPALIPVSAAFRSLKPIGEAVNQFFKALG